MKYNTLVAQISGIEDKLEVPMPGDPDSNTISEVVTIVFGIGGAIAMLVIVIAGIQFILSQGDPQKAATARSAIIYAAVGLVIMVLAFAIVSFVAEQL